MRYGHWLLLAVIATGVPSRLAGQEVLTLDQAVQSALARNTSIAAARAGAAEAAAAADTARAGYFPRFSFAESWQRGDQPVFVFSSLLSARRFAAPNFAIDALNNPDPIGFFHASFGLEQLVFDGGRTRAAVRSAALRREVADRGATQAAADVALATTQAYGRVLTAQAARRSADGAVAAAQEDLARAEHRRDAGTANDADVLGIAAHLASMRLRAIESAGEEAVARAELNRLIGGPIAREYRVAEPMVAAPDVHDVALLLAEAERSRADLQRADAALRVAAAGVDSARAGWMPQVAAQAGYELNGTHFTDRASGWIFGGEIRWSLSTGGAEASQLRAAHENARRAEAERDTARAAVEVDIITASRRLEAATARQTVAASALEQARESQRIIRDRFDAGLLGITEVLRAATALLDADAQRTAAIVDAAVSDAMLRRAVGRAP